MPFIRSVFLLSAPDFVSCGGNSVAELILAVRL